jgi:hypothetical protein
MIAWRRGDGAAAADILPKDAIQIAWALGTMGSDNGDVDDALVHLDDAIRGHWIDGRESRRPLAGWMCADLAQMATAMAHGRLDNQDVLSAVYEESLGRILTGSGGDGRRGPWRNNRGANGGFSTTEISILLWVQARLYLMPNRRDVTPHFPAPPCTRCCDGWTPAPGRTQQRARGGAGKRGVRCFFFTGLGKGDDPMEGGRGVVPPQHCGGIY